MKENCNSILVIGATTLDRLLYVDNFPRADSKGICKTEELGGGNAANTASAIGLLMHDGSVENCNGNTEIGYSPTRVQLLSKVSTDEVGRSLVKELQGYNVDLSSPLFVRALGNSPVVTIIVTNTPPHTRTCLFDPGTVGTLEVSDINNCDDGERDVIGVMMSQCIHYHSDSRQTEVAVFLAREAKLRNVPISVDIERDRFSSQFDELVDCADIIFTNADLMQSILLRRLGYNIFDEIEIDEASIDKEVRDCYRCHLEFYCKVALLSYCLHVFRGLQDLSKELIVTRGELGVVHCKMVNHSSVFGHKEHSSEISKTIMEGRRNVMSFICIDENLINIAHKLYANSSTDDKMIKIEENTFSLHIVGVLSDSKVVDTTGSGDAFAGGYIYCKTKMTDGSLDASACTLFQLRFASWVAGKKLSGIGAKKALPTFEDVKTILGKDIPEMDYFLKELIQSSVHMR